MARRRGVAAALLVVAAVSACSSDGSPVGSPSSTVGVGVAAAASATEGFTSAQYGYTALAPEGWSVQPATAGWDGGDVDHTAGYADRFDGSDEGFIFTIGSPASAPLPEFAEGHVSWVKVNRGCQRASDPVNSDLDGVPAVRVALRCGAGIYGPTLVSKAIVVRDGVGVIFTAFSPDSGGDSFPVFEDFLASVRWSTT